MGIRYTANDGRQFRFSGLFADFAIFHSMVETVDDSDGIPCVAECVFDLTKDQVGFILSSMQGWFDDELWFTWRDVRTFNIARDWHTSANDNDVMSFG